MDVTFAMIRQGVYVFASVCLSVCLKSCRRIFTKFLRGGTYLTSNSWLDFDGDPNHGADTGIFKSTFYYYGIGTFFYEFRWKKLSTISYEIFEE